MGVVPTVRVARITAAIHRQAAEVEVFKVLRGQLRTLVDFVPCPRYGASTILVSNVHHFLNNTCVWY